jgi:glycerol-3-phosphate cytidylyltransferase-like family protein
LVVALESDESIVAYKKRHPVFNQIQRAANLAANRYVDEVILLPRLGAYNDYMQMVLDVCPDVIAVTKGDPQVDNIKKQAKAIGAELVEVISLVDGVSTTELINKIKNP